MLSLSSGAAKASYLPARERIGRLEAQIAQCGMFIRTAAKRPVILALRLLDCEIIDRSEPQTHQSVLVELPIFIAIRAEPIS